MWHSKTNAEVLKELDVDPIYGLSETEARSRLVEYGPNTLKGKKKKNIFQLFVAQLRDWLIYVLFIAVVITLVMGEFIDSTIILSVIILNAVLGVIQEVKAGKAIDALRKMSSPRALVRRDGNLKEVSTDKIVPGDILILEAGRFIAADVRIIHSVNLQIEESALTGESVPSLKDATIIHNDPSTPLGDRANSAYMLTMATYGKGVGVVVETGMNTEVGKIAIIIDREEEPKTPLEIRLGKLGKTLGRLAIGICSFIFIISFFQGRDMAEMFLTSVSLAVAAIPEGLAAIVAVVLSIGVTSMSKRNAIVKRLPAVETLGSVNIICSDKTGTLTQNKMTVTKYFNLEGEKSVGQRENGEVTTDSLFLAKAMILCSDATYENGQGTGDPTEIALMRFGDDLGIDREFLMAVNKRVGECSFDSDRKLMSTLNEENGKLTVYTKGAIDNLIKISTHVLEKGQVVPISEFHKNQFYAAIENVSNQALRTLGVAYKPVTTHIDISEMEKDLILIGFVGMIDPPREEVKLSIQKAKSAGITTIMITGDHKNTAFAVAQDLGVAETTGQIITGAEIDKFSDNEFSEYVLRYRVFARVSPGHKVKIVRALQSHGYVVSMTGDGINDAPSLNAADIGVAMGIAGADVAKEASDMILADDNYATIVSAIEEGRNIYNNIKKSVIFLLTCNFGEIITMLVALLIGWEAPLIATQLLWINLITDSLPAIALGMDTGDPDVMKEKPRNPNETFFSGRDSLNAFLGGSLIGVLTIIAFRYGYYEKGYSPSDGSAPESVVEFARTLAFLVLVNSQLFFSLAIRNSSKSILKLGLFTNRYIWGAIVAGLSMQLVVVTIPALQSAFKMQIPDSRDWIIVLVLGLIPLVFAELKKSLSLRAK